MNKGCVIKEKKSCCALFYHRYYTQTFSQFCSLSCCVLRTELTKRLCVISVIYFFSTDFFFYGSEATLYYCLLYYVLQIALISWFYSFFYSKKENTLKLQCISIKFVIYDHSFVFLKLQKAMILGKKFITSTPITKLYLILQCMPILIMNFLYIIQ